jgi:hypothetical protein
VSSGEFGSHRQDACATIFRALSEEALSNGIEIISSSPQDSLKCGYEGKLKSRRRRNFLRIRGFIFQTDDYHAD